MNNHPESRLQARPWNPRVSAPPELTEWLTEKLALFASVGKRPRAQVLALASAVLIDLAHAYTTESCVHLSLMRKAGPTRSLPKVIHLLADLNIVSLVIGSKQLRLQTEIALTPEHAPPVLTVEAFTAARERAAARKRAGNITSPLAVALTP